MSKLCIKCPVYKYDGKSFSCPLHPYVDMNSEARGMFSTVQECPGAEEYAMILVEKCDDAYTKIRRVRIMKDDIEDSLRHVYSKPQLRLLREQRAMAERDEEQLLSRIAFYEKELKRILKYADQSIREQN